MSQSLINPYIFEAVIPPPVTGDGAWIELGRTTLGGVSDDVIVTGLPNVEYYMILADIIETTNLQPVVRFGDNGSPDVGANYANRRSDNGGADITSGTDNEIISNTVDAALKYWFDIGWISNLFEHEKLMVGRTARSQTGDNTAPFRSEFTGKWVNDIPIDTIALRNLSTGDFQAGTELVVVGWSRFDNNPVASNFWELLAEVTAVGGETVITTPVFTPRKYMWISGFAENSVDGGQYQMRIGHDVIDSSLNYHTRFANNEFGGGSESPNTALDHVTLNNLGNQTKSTVHFYLNNKDGQEKILLGKVFATGAFSPPNTRQHWTVKWDGQSNGTINIVQMYQAIAPATLIAGSGIRVWGHD